MDNFFRTLTSPLIFDGATGTQLQKRGMPPGSCSELWLLEHPEAIDFQRLYVDSGSRAVYAPTFSANRVLLGRHGLGDRVAELNRRLVELSRGAVGEGVYVGGDISSTGLVYGSADEEQFDMLFAAYREQAEALEAAGVDFFAVETQLSLSECRAAVMAVREVSSKPVLASFTLSPAGRTFGGGLLTSALLALSDLGIDAFGINCVDDPQLIARALTELRGMTSLPLLVKPNAGFPQMVGDRAVYRLSPVTMGEMAEHFYELGADLFGGCCGSDEGHIAAIAAVLLGRPLRPHSPTEKRFAASAYELVDLDGDLPGAELALDGDFEEKAGALGADGIRLLRVHAGTEEQLHILLSTQGTVHTPLSVSFGNDALRARFLRYYAGRAELR